MIFSGDLMISYFVMLAVTIIQLIAILPISFIMSAEKNLRLTQAPSSIHYTPDITIFLPVRNEAVNIKRKILEV